MKNLAAMIALLSGILPSIVAADAGQDKRIAELEREVQALRARVEALEGSRTPGKPAAASTKPGNSKDIKNWRKLRMGMTEAEVESLLGSPDKVMENTVFIGWYFDYPTGGDVRFNPKTRRVDAWNE